MIFVVFILFYVAGVLNGTMDAISFHYNKSKLFPTGDQKLLGAGEQFWNPKISHLNKYKDGDPENGPRFIGSTTVFVWTTDAWHMAKSGMMMFMTAAAVIVALMTPPIPPYVLNYLLVFGIFRMLYMMGFHTTYTILFD